MNGLNVTTLIVSKILEDLHIHFFTTLNDAKTSARMAAGRTAQII